MLIASERPSLTPEQETALRLYRRLWLTEIDLEEARGAINEILKRNLRRTSTNTPTPLLQALTTAFIVAYTRPFVMSRGCAEFADRTVPGSILRVFTAGERALHDHLLQIRNREVAHSDADVTEVTLEILPEGHGGICRVARGPLPRPQLRQLLQMIDKVETELESRFEALRKQLPHNVWI